MDFTLYWFMLPMAIFVATTAMMSGIAGTALFMPIFLLCFPLLGSEYVLNNSAAAIAVALLTSTFGFISGSWAYYRQQLIDFELAKRFIKFTIPAAIIGAIVCPLINDQIIRLLYSVLILLLAALLLRKDQKTNRQASPQKETGLKKTIAKNGAVYQYFPFKPIASPTLLGGFITGLLSVGTGEAVMPQLIKKGNIPVPVAAATSVLIVFLTFLCASVTHVASLLLEGGLNAVPWHLLCYTIPGVIIGGQIGPRLQGKIDPQKMTRAIALVFACIGIAMLMIVVKKFVG